MSIERMLSGDTITVTPYAGEGAYGPVYGPAVEVDCRVQVNRKLVRNTSGDEVVSETTVYVLPEIAGVRAVDLFQPESVVIHDGRQSMVLGCVSHRGMAAAVLVEVATT